MGAGEFFEWLYRRGGWRLLTRPALAAIAVVVVAGLVAFPYLVVGRYGTPFVVAHKIGIGGLVFLLGRFGVVAVHETAHGLTLASYGRRVRKAGLKLLLIFPYAYVDTSEAWFEPRRRRIAISAAGPVSDLSLGAIFALVCLALPAGVLRDIFFQLAFAAYLGAFFNLNPFVDRDGYQILVDVLREPGLRRRAREQFLQRRGGERAGLRFPGACPLRGLRGSLVGRGGLLCGRDVAALRAVVDAGRTRACGVGGVGRARAGFLPAGAGIAGGAGT